MIFIVILPHSIFNTLQNCCKMSSSKFICPYNFIYVYILLILSNSFIYELNYFSQMELFLAQDETPLIRLNLAVNE